MSTADTMSDTKRRPDVPAPLVTPASTDIIAAARPADLVQPFQEERAGFDYFATDYHHRYLARAIRTGLASKRGFVLVAGDPLPDGELLARFLGDEAGYRATMVRCQEGGGFNDLIRAYGDKLGVKSEDDRSSLWALLSLLMVDSRNGLAGILVVEHAEFLDAAGLDELCRFSKLDDPHLLSVVLLATPALSERLSEPSFQFLRSMIVASLRHQHLDAAEVGAFIQFQLNRTRGGETLPSDVIGMIAEVSEGDPIMVNRLACQALTGKDRAENAALALPPPAEPTAQPEEAAANEAAAETDTKPPALSAAAALPVELERGRTRMFSGAILAAYVVAVTLSGATLLYWFRPAHRPEAVLPVITASLPQSSPPAAPPPAAPTPAPAPTAAAIPAPPPAATEPANPAPAQNAAVPSAASTEASATAPSSDDSEAASASDSASDTVPAAPVPPAAQTATATDQPAADDSAGQPVDHPPVSATADTAAPEAPAPAPTPKTAQTDAPPAPAPEAASASTQDSAPAASPAAPQLSASEPAPAEEAAPSPSTAAAVAAIEPSAPAPDLPHREAANVAVPPPPLATEHETLSASDIALLLRRGDELLEAGDIVSARHFFERVVAAGDAAGAIGLGKSYDPLFLRQLRARGIAPDSQKAALWYRQAAAAGSTEAAQRLYRLLGVTPR